MMCAYLTQIILFCSLLAANREQLQGLLPKLWVVLVCRHFYNLEACVRQKPKEKLIARSAARLVGKHDRRILPACSSSRKAHEPHTRTRARSHVLCSVKNTSVFTRGSINSSTPAQSTTPPVCTVCERCCARQRQRAQRRTHDVRRNDVIDAVSEHPGRKPAQTA
jgi:hypothetical protein